jgi:SAM-dependent methyltransferase
MTQIITHPAKFSSKFIPLFANLLKDFHNVLDPMAGTGKLGLIKEYGWVGKVTCNEIEPEWMDRGYPVDAWFNVDAAHMEFAKDGEFDSICSSPTYGNRMADHHDAKDGSKRISYKFCLGRDLNPENTGAMQWGMAYRAKNWDIYKECYRVLGDNGLLVINISNHIRKGIETDVVGWTRESLVRLGFVFQENFQVETPRMRNGENAEKRVPVECILVFKKGGSK